MTVLYVCGALLVCCLALTTNGAVTQSRYFPILWNFYSSNASCNSYNNISLGSDILGIESGRPQFSGSSICNVTVTLTDNSRVAVYIEIEGSVSCGNSLYIIGLCNTSSKMDQICKEEEVTCESPTSQHHSWDTVREIIISYKVTNNNLEDDFRIQISPAYAVGKKEKGVLKSLAKGVVIIIVVVVVVVVLCAVGIPAVICCCCKHGRSSGSNDNVRYVNPGSVQPVYPVIAPHHRY
ncbi:hypothetical protein EB796_009232 [Bugula neritina]|uniref:Uncharacterized protein n=1 Tax=Bugula neritina TaxID=10212 RepID=A0A7J7K491_BUGNE|nr:hypothetical protein EB796_009232 [Bugula neritina]